MMERRHVQESATDDYPPKRCRHHCSHSEILHSGQFMNSNVHEGTAADETFDEEDSCYSAVNGPRRLPWMDVIDVHTLDQLVERISSTYCARFTSPRGLDFTGCGLRWGDKVRMNNLLWREWHLQFTSRHGSSFCQFMDPLDDPIHRKPLAVVLEGKYWKRKLDAVSGEYKRRRVYWRERQRWKRRQSDDSQMSFDDKVSEKSSGMSSMAGDPGWKTQNSEDSPCTRVVDDTSVASCMPSSWASGQRRAPDQHSSGCIGSTSEQDSYAVTLIEEFLRNGEMDWRSDHVPDSPSSLQDAVDILATVVDVQKELTSQCTPAQCIKIEMLLQPSQEHSNDLIATSQDNSLSVRHLLTDPLSLAPTASDPPGGGSGSDFNVLRQIVPSLCGSHPRKMTKATMLQHTAQYCKEMRQDNNQLDDQISLLKLQVELLKRQAVGVQNQIPTKETLHDNLRREMFDAWVRARSSHNCKFSVFALLLAPLYLAFMSSVSSTSEDELKRTILEWLHKSCSLASFRKSVLSSLTVLSQSTSILANPEKLPQELLSKTRSSWLLDARNASQ